jgi:hypothetical protein
MEHDVSKRIDHPAAYALGLLHPELGAPTRIVTLKDHPESSTFRLEGVGPTGSPLVAKHSARPSAVVERRVYEDILPLISVSQPLYYGSWTSPEDSSTWFFTEDLGDEWYDPTNARHRQLAAEWLGELHTTATAFPEVSLLPDRGPQHYLSVLRTTLARIPDAWVNPAQSDREPLDEILRQLQLVELHWDEVEDICANVPKTLVHGDFVDKNIRVRCEADRLILLPFDWESAGFGTPAVDLETPDAAAYQAVVRSLWPQCDLRASQALASVGRLFRLIMLIFWGSEKLTSPWGERALSKQMVFYGLWLASAIQAAGW